MPSAEYQREWKKKNPGKQAEYSRKYYTKNKEKYREKRLRKNLTLEELEKVRTQGRVHNQKNKDKRYAWTREWCERNKEHRKEYNRNWYKTPKGILHSTKERHKRRARKLKAEGSFTAENIKDMYATQGGRCYYCSVEIDSGYHIEHMTPLSRGGMNNVSNICLACAPCNLSKHTKTAEEFKEKYYVERMYSNA